MAPPACSAPPAVRIAMLALALLGCTLLAWAAPELHAAANAPTDALQAERPAAAPALQAAPVQSAPLSPAGPAQPAALQPAGDPGANALQMAPLASNEPPPSVARLKQLAARKSRAGSAAERANAQAAWLLGLLYLHGSGVPTDRAQAQRWFERARALGSPLASAGLAWCEIDGCRGPPAPAAARVWIQALAPVDRARSQYLEWLATERMAPLQMDRPGPPNAAAQEQAARQHALLVRAARGGSAAAANELGLEETAAGRLPEALEQFRSASARSPAAAANASLLAGRIASAAPGSAPLATPQRNAQGWYNDARRYHRGDGVPANYSEAIRLYQLAAGQGSKPAQRMLERIFSRPSPTGGIDIAWMHQLANLELGEDQAVLTVLPPPSPRLFGRDPTPLYDLVPLQWRVAPGSGTPAPLR